jgi:hypothetical protein
MAKKKIAQAMLAMGLGVGLAIAAVMDPNTRMEKVKDLFTQYGDDTFKVLNGQGIGGVGSTADGKGQQAGGYADVATVVNSTDDNAFVFCVVDSKWAVYPPEPNKIGKDAMTATDSHGTPFVSTLIKALQNSPDGKAYKIPYFVTTPGGLEERLATVWSSKNLLTRKNGTGKKFFCGTSVKASS